MTDDNTPLCPVFGVDRWLSQAQLKQSAGHTKLKSWGFCFISTVKNTFFNIYTCTQVYQSYIPDKNVCWTSAASCPLVDLIGCSSGVGGEGEGHGWWIYVTQLWQNKINKSNLDGTLKRFYIEVYDSAAVVKATTRNESVNIDLKWWHNEVQFRNTDTDKQAIKPVRGRER